MPKLPGLTEIPSQGRKQDEFLIQRKLGEAIRISLAAMTTEPLPDGMALLLLRLALAELVKDSSGDAADDSDEDGTGLP